MTDNHDLSQERQNAIAVGRSFGWTVTRDGKRWKFTRPDTGGLWDVFYIGHKSLSVQAVLGKLRVYEGQLAVRVSMAVNEVQSDWLREQRPQQASEWLGQSEARHD